MLKREIKYMIVAAATALAAVSCVNKINDYDAERIISFKALRANSTKSHSKTSPSTNNPSTKTPSNAEETGAFKVWGYALPQEKNWKDDFNGGRKLCWKAKTTSTPTESGKAPKITCGVQVLRE